MQKGFIALFELYPHPVLVITRSEDSTVLVYDAILEHDKIKQVHLMAVDLHKMPLKPTRMEGTGTKLEKLFAMRILPHADGKRYELTIPVMPDKTMQAFVRDGRVVAKTKIGTGMHCVHRVFVHLTWTFKVPKIHWIDLYGRDAHGVTVSERIPNPSILDLASI